MTDDDDADMGIKKGGFFYCTKTKEISNKTNERVSEKCEN